MSETVKVAVIGHPVAHSKSPLIHNRWIKQYGLDGSYEAIDLTPEGLADGIKRLVDEGFKGFNLTVPHKEAGLDLCDSVEHNAQSIGAVNTIVVEDGNLRGLNTDSFGFLNNIYDVDPHFNLEDKKAVVLGAGGASRAVISGLIGEHIGQITLINRTRGKAEKIKGEMGFMSDLIEVVDWGDRDKALEEAQLLVNTTSLGMDGQPKLDIKLDALLKEALVNDIIYAPLYTDLLKAAETRGHKVVTGIGMLLHQARPAFKEWFGVMPDIDEDLQKLVL